VATVVRTTDRVNNQRRLTDHRCRARQQLRRVPVLQVVHQGPAHGGDAKQRDQREDDGLADGAEANERSHSSPDRPQRDEGGEESQRHHLSDCEEQGHCNPDERHAITSMSQNASAQNLVVTREEMRARVASAAVARLATIGRDGAPHLVPFCFVLDADVLYSAVDRKPKRTASLRRLQNTAADPRVSVLIDHYENDWSRLWWIRLDGRARTLETGTEFRRALFRLGAKYAQYRLDPPPGPVLRIDVERWTGWAAADAAPGR